MITKILSLVLLALTVFIYYNLPSCEEEKQVFNINVSAPGVKLISHSVEKGKLKPEEVQKGLDNSVLVLSDLYKTQLENSPELTGDLRGIFFVDKDGAARMFIEKGSEFEPEEGIIIAAELIKSAMNSEIQFPETGRQILVKVHFQFQPLAANP